MYYIDYNIGYYIAILAQTSSKTNRDPQIQGRTEIKASPDLIF